MKEYMNVDKNLFASYTDKETLDRIVMRSSLAEMWEKCEEEFKDKIAIQDGKEWTYAELGRDIARYRGALVNKGVKKGDKVCMLVPSCYDFAKVFFAITTLGAVAVLLPVQLDEKTIFGCTKKFGADLIVYHETLEEKIELAKTMGVKTIKTAEEGELTPANEIEPDDIQDRLNNLFN